MADNLIFPIGFDLDKAVEQAKGEWSGVQKKMETMIASKPLRVPIVIEQSKALLDADGQIKAATGSIKAMRSEMASLIKRWDELSQSERLATDANGKFIGEAGQIVNRFAELTAASRTYARSLSELQSAADKAVAIQERSFQKQQAEDEKRYQQWLALKDKEVQQTEAAEIKKENARRRVISKQNETQRTREDARYDAYWKNAEKEAAKVEAAEAKKRAAYAASASAQRQAAHAQAQAAFKIAQALKAQETSLDAINAKLQIYQQQIRGQQVGSAEWNKSALEIRRLTEELQKASQQMADFQQKSFKGLSDSLTVGKVQALTQYRNELAKVEAEFNKLNQTGAAYDSKGGLTQAANNILKQRQDIIKNINQMLTTAADAQVQREKEINNIIEQRKAKADAIAAKRKAEQAAIQGNIAKLKEERRILNQQESSIANITAKLQIQQQRLQSAKLGSSEFTKTAKEVERLTMKLEDAKRKVDEVTGRVVSGARQQVTRELGNQTTYLQRLIQRMVAYYSLRQIGNFLTNIREVTAQFELQRVSLGAIIQDQQRANALFSEIKSFALKSPVSIMDLTKYTKQLAAYKIGVDELFETTKKLTDVSVGLGVSMDRVVLAYGQVRARGALYSSEIRQFTEMGVPIVEELAAKLTKMNGELVTAKDVLKQVEKGAISFELVKEVFDDMTSAGGMFYNMQEKQGNTLFGLWAKLGDAVSVMYDEIGNTESVNKGMKEAIQLLTDMMKNWRGVANEIQLLAAGFVVFKASSAIMKAMQVNTIAAAAATRSMTRASIAHRTAVAAGNPVMGAYTNMLRTVAVWNRKAALSTNLFTVAANKLKVALVSWGPMAIIAGLSLLISYLINAAEKAGRLKRELDSIGAETGTEISRLVTNFESLAKKAVEAADGSREQKDALSELQRTYRSIIPEQNLTIDKLREMKGEYTNLTIAIREYIREQQLQKGLSAISENYGKQIIDTEREFRDKLKTTKIESKGGTGFYLDERQIDRIVGYYKVLVREGKSAQEALEETFRVEGINDLINDYGKLAKNLGLVAGTETAIMDKDFNTINTVIIKGAAGLTEAIQDEEKAIMNFRKQMDGTVPTLGRLTDYIDIAKKKISEHVFVSKEQTFAYDQETARVQINSYIEALEEAIKYTNVGIDLSEFITIDPNGIKRLDIKGLKDALTELDSPWKAQLQDFAKEVQNVYDGFIPNDRTTASLSNKLEQITAHTGASMDKMRKFLMKNGDNWKDYSKKIEDSIKDYKDAIEEMNKSNAAVTSGENSVLKMYSTEEIETANKEMQTLILLLKYLKKSSSSGRTSQSDPRLGILQEMVSTLKQVNKEYDDLAKKEGATKALADTQKIYADTFKNMQALAKQYDFELPKFGVPTDTASLTKYLEAIKTAMAKLPKSQKAVLALQVDIDKLDIDDKQKQIEEELKRLADQVSRTKTAQEFYNKILGTTGDIDLAANMTMSIYGDAGTDVQGQMANYISELFGKYDIQVPVNIVSEDGEIDYTAMEKYVRDNEKILGNGYKELLKIAQNGQKDLAKVAEEAAKLLMQYDNIAQQRVNIEKEASDKIKTLREAEAQYLASSASEEEKRAYSKRTQQAVAGVEADRDLKLLKLQSSYMRFFSAIHALTNKEAEALRTKVRKSLFDAFQSGSMSADELKRELKTVDEQFKKLIDDSGMARDFLKDGFNGLIKKLRETADEVQSVAEELSKMESADQITEGQKNFIDKILGKFGDKSTGSNFASLFSKTNGDLKQMGSLLGNVSGKIGGMASAFGGALGVVDMIIQAVNSTIKGISQIRDQLNGMRSDTNKLEGGFWDAFEFLEEFNKYAYSGWEKLKSGDAIGATFDVASSIIGLFSIGLKHRVRKLNKQIKEQGKLIEELEHSYERLEKVLQRSFGTDYLANYNKQLENLKAQQEAYEKQAELERKKGKAEDKDKTDEYMKQARDTADQIKDLQDELVANLVGTDLGSAAKEFADAWLDAYLTFGDTAGAIEEKFNDMIKNLVVHQALAGVVQRVLQPFYDEIDKAASDKELSSEELANIMSKLPGYISMIDDGLSVSMEALRQAGFDLESLRDTTSGLKGISRDIASASEESINGLAAGINTQNFYISQIHANVAMIAQYMLNGNKVPYTGGMSMQELVTMQNTYLSTLPAIEANTAAMVVRCERTAQACENLYNQMSRVIRPAGTKATYTICTTLN